MKNNYKLREKISTIFLYIALILVYVIAIFGIFTFFFETSWATLVAMILGLILGLSTSLFIMIYPTKKEK